MRRLVAFLCTTFALATPANAETLELINGDKLTGEIVETSDEQIVLESPIFGRLTIPTDQIAPPEAEKIDPGAFGTGLFRGWERQIAVGGSGAAGNTEKMGLNGALLLSTEDDTRRWKFSASYFWGSSDGDEDTNKAFVDLERDWKLSESNFYLFARTGYDYDSFRGFNHRVDGSTGIGYWWIDWERWRFGTRLGAGASYQWQSESTFRPELVGGLDSIWTLAIGPTLEIHADIFPDLADTNEYRTHTTAGWKFALTEVIGLSIGAIHEYHSETARRHHDVTYQGALTYDF